MKRLRLKNFKCFEDTGDLKIAPITILIGPNSSGKSSLLQPLLMLKQTVDSRDVTSPLVVNGSYVKLSSYESFVNDHDIKKEFEVDFSFTGKDRTTAFLFRTKENQALFNIKAVFIFNKAQKRIELKTAKIDFDGNELFIEQLRKARSIRYQISSSIKSENEGKPIILPRAVPYKFYNYLRKVVSRKRIDMKVNRIRFTVRNEIEDFLNNINYLGPLREFPQHLYVSGGELRKDVGLKGEYSADVLWTQDQGAKRRQGLLRNVNKWIEIFQLGSSVTIKTMGRYTGFFQILIKNFYKNVSASISNVGFGVSQVLPLIVEGFYSDPNSTLLIEQPEIHLHPKVQADLGDLFIDITKEGRNLIVETHSEHIISRLARRIAEGIISKSDIAIYFFSSDNKGTAIKQINIDENGRFDNWPEGFFEENYLEALMHNQIIAGKLNKE